MQTADPADIEVQFISGWIAFNALYGRLGSDQRSIPERQAMQKFLVLVHGLDQNDAITHLLIGNQRKVLALINDRFLYGPFWTKTPRVREKLDEIVTATIHHLARGESLPVLLEVFERLYILRQQLFHGASTRGSRLNRDGLKRCTTILGMLLPTIIDIMIEDELQQNWGDVCFPPME